MSNVLIWDQAFYFFDRKQQSTVDEMSQVIERRLNTDLN